MLQICNDGAKLRTEDDWRCKMYWGSETYNYLCVAKIVCMCLFCRVLVLLVKSGEATWRYCGTKRSNLVQLIALSIQYFYGPRELGSVVQAKQPEHTDHCREGINKGITDENCQLWTCLIAQTTCIWINVWSNFNMAALNTFQSSHNLVGCFGKQYSVVKMPGNGFHSLSFCLSGGSSLFGHVIDDCINVFQNIPEVFRHRTGFGSFVSACGEQPSPVEFLKQLFVKIWSGLAYYILALLAKIPHLYW